MPVAGLMIVVLLIAGLVFAYARVHIRILRATKATSGGVWSTVQAYASWLFFSFVIVPVGIFTPLWANNRLGAVAASQIATAALIIGGSAVVLIATVIAYRSKSPES